VLFQSWYSEAEACDAIAEPTAVTLATVDKDDMPSARIVLLKDVSEGGFVFYTNLGSDKVCDLAENPKAALCFYWMPLDKQIRVQGEVVPVSAQEADAYFASRPRESQIGAWASKQSQTMPQRFSLEKSIARYGIKFGLGKVPRPEFWSGFRLKAQRIEFWLKRPFRLHERIRYSADAGAGDDWTRQRLYP
jgi:pyridoxamine 5'-phosphate oxidase